jgi:uncharacterized protein
MKRWNIKQVLKKVPKLNKPIFVEALPGIGNVGKIVGDFLIEELKAKKFLEITSSVFPHSVFVNEENLIDLPVIDLYYKKMKKGSDIIIMTGEIQPINEEGCYEFCDEIMKIIKKYKCKEVITTGGIGLRQTHTPPKIYCTGNDQKIVERFVKKKHKNLQNKIFGVVGPIVGVTGLLLGIAKQGKVPAMSLLSETVAHPLYVGIKGSREIVKIISAQYDLGIDIKKIDKEIKSLEKQFTAKNKKMLQLQQQQAKAEGISQDYIG